MALEDLPDDELRNKLSKRLTWLEKGYDDAARRFKERSSGGNDNWMKFAVRAEKMRDGLKFLHGDATLLESDFCDEVGEPMEIVLLSER